MGNRLTNRWTKTAAEAFGHTGHKGRKAELLIINNLRKNGYLVEDYEDNFKKQKCGIDLAYRKPDFDLWTTVDVKANLNEYGTFYVYSDWITINESQYIVHVNVDTLWCARYLTHVMQQYWDEHFKEHSYQKRGYGGHLVSDKEHMTFNPKNSPEFVTRFQLNDGVLPSD